MSQIAPVLHREPVEVVEAGDPKGELRVRVKDIAALTVTGLATLKAKSNG